MEIRLAFPNEVDAIMQVMEDAKKCLAESGSDQWQNGYPNADIIKIGRAHVWTPVTR